MSASYETSSSDLNQTNYLPGWEPSYDFSGYLSGDGGKFLRDYIQVAPDHLQSHIKSIAKQGWEVTDFPCFARYWFLRSELSLSPVYSEVISRLKTGSLLLDVACGVGQDIRRLVYDGAPAENIIGVDVDKEYKELGFDLITDRETFRAKYIVDDVLTPGPELAEYAGKINVVNASHFLHIFTLEKQVQAAKQMVEMLYPDEDSLVTGVICGVPNPGVHTPKESKIPPAYVHNTSTFFDLWDQISKETQRELSVWMSIERGKAAGLQANAFFIRWYVRVSKRI